MTSPLYVKKLLAADGPAAVAAVPPGMEAMILADMARSGAAIAYLVSDGQRLADLTQLLSFFAPDIPVLTLPGWDCLPYDRVSPGTDVAAERLSTLASLARHANQPHAAILLATANAVLQKVPPREVIEALAFSARPVRSSAWKTSPHGWSATASNVCRRPRGRRVRRARRYP